MNRKELKKQIKADANPEKLVAAIKRKDRSYIRGALQWYARMPTRRTLRTFLEQCLSDCSSSSQSRDSSSSGR